MSDNISSQDVPRMVKRRFSQTEDCVVHCDTPDRVLLQQTASVAQKRRRLGSRLQAAVTKCVTSDHIYDSIGPAMGKEKICCFSSCIRGNNNSVESENYYEEIAELETFSTQYRPLNTVDPDVPSVGSRGFDTGSSSGFSSDSSSSSLKSTSMYQEYRGQLNIRIVEDEQELKVHVYSARQLLCGKNIVCNSYVQVSLIPEMLGDQVYTTAVKQKNDAPEFNETFRIQLSGYDYIKRRMLISVMNHDVPTGSALVVGCMSFGIGNLAKNMNQVDGWYYLLKEQTGMVAHMQVRDDLSNTVSPITQKSIRRRSQSSISSGSSGSTVSSYISARSSSGYSVDTSVIETFKKRLNEMPTSVELLTIPVVKGKDGYGITLSNGSPVQISAVATNSSADKCGLKVGDSVIRVNGQFVHKMYADTVGRIIRHYPKHILMDVLRTNTDSTDVSTMTTNFHLLQRIAEDYISASDSSSSDDEQYIPSGSLV